MNNTLGYLTKPLPSLAFYGSASEAEEAYMSFITSVDAANRRVIGVDFAEFDVPSTVNYSLRFPSRDVGNTKVLFNHARKQMMTLVF